MDVDRKDLALIAVFSMLFLSLSSSNLGSMRIPTSSFRASGGEVVYLELGSFVKVKSLYVLIGDSGSLRLHLYLREAEGWAWADFLGEGGYFSWKKLKVDGVTDRLKLTFDSSTGNINEVVAVGDLGERLKIAEAICEGSIGSGVQRLVDEQDWFESPPTYMSETYFDEIYFVKTARQFLDLEEPLEWTHPPLGKLLIALGISIFGFSPFGWRVLGVLFATLMVPLVYLLGKLIFTSRVAASFSAFLLTFEFLHFTMARLGTVDNFLIFFVTASTFFFYANFKGMYVEGLEPSYRQIFLGVLFFSLALSVKWTALYAAASQFTLVAFCFLRRFNNSTGSLKVKMRTLILKPFAIVLGFLVIGGAVYASTFIPYMMIGHDAWDVYSLQWRMYSYHSSLSASHPYSSEWWTWPLVVKPLWLFFAELPEGYVSTIVAMGNPFIWWLGFAFLLAALVKAVRKGEPRYIFICTTFLFGWLPYIFVSRCLFIYHYYPNVPLLILVSSGFLAEEWSSSRGRLLVKIYLLAVVATFVIFYPVISGVIIPGWYREPLRWLKSWVF